MVPDLKAHVADFQHWLKTDPGDAATWQREREERLMWYRTHLTRAGVAKLSPEDFATMVKSLWAVNIWHNKEYKVGKLIEDNGLEKIRTSLTDLLYGDSAIDKRWDAFRTLIKGFGPLVAQRDTYVL